MERNYNGNGYGCSDGAYDGAYVFYAKDMNNMHNEMKSISQSKHDTKAEESKTNPNQKSESKVDEENEKHPKEQKHTH